MSTIFHIFQHIPIRQKLQEAQKELEGPVYKIARKTVPKIVPKFMKF